MLMWTGDRWALAFFHSNRIIPICIHIPVSLTYCLLPIVSPSPSLYLSFAPSHILLRIYDFSCLSAVCAHSRLHCSCCLAQYFVLGASLRTAGATERQHSPSHRQKVQPSFGSYCPPRAPNSNSNTNRS